MVAIRSMRVIPAQARRAANMNRNWSPPTPCDMRCPDCRADLPRGTRAHTCDTVRREQHNAKNRAYWKRRKVKRDLV